MYIRKAFEFVVLWSEAEWLEAFGDSDDGVVGDDKVVSDDWVVDWRWFGEWALVQADQG